MGPRLGRPPPGEDRAGWAGWVATKPVPIRRSFTPAAAAGRVWPHWRSRTWATYLRARRVEQGWSVQPIRAELGVGRGWLWSEMAALWLP